MPAQANESEMWIPFLCLPIPDFSHLSFDDDGDDDGDKGGKELNPNFRHSGKLTTDEKREGKENRGGEEEPYGRHPKKLWGPSSFLQGTKLGKKCNIPPLFSDKAVSSSPLLFYLRTHPFLLSITHHDDPI